MGQLISFLRHILQINRGLCPLACRRPPRTITRVSIQAGSRCFVYLPNPTLLPHLYSARASLPCSRTTTCDAHHQKSPESASCAVSLLPWPRPSPILSSYVLSLSLGIYTHTHTHSLSPNDMSLHFSRCPEQFGWPGGSLLLGSSWEYLKTLENSDWKSFQDWIPNLHHHILLCGAWAQLLLRGPLLYLRSCVTLRESHLINVCNWISPWGRNVASCKRRMLLNQALKT